MINMLQLVKMATALAAIFIVAGCTKSEVVANADDDWHAVYTDAGEIKLPVGYRQWVFVGAPMTPNGLNNGAAGFPEFHNVYVPKQIGRAHV